MNFIEQLRELAGRATPGVWETEYDPIDNGDHPTAIYLPGRAGLPGTFLAYFQHNWNDAYAGERRISWKEAETNAALIVHLHNSIPEILAMAEENERLREALKGLFAASDLSTTSAPAGDKVNAWAAAFSKARAALEGATKS